MSTVQKSPYDTAGVAEPCLDDASRHHTNGPEFARPAIAGPAPEEPARLIVAPPLSAELKRGLIVIQYRADNLRIVPVYGSAALKVTP